MRHSQQVRRIITLPECSAKLKTTDSSRAAGTFTQNMAVECVL